MQASMVDPNRTCQVCGGPISRRNSIGICWGKPACRRIAQAVYDLRTQPTHRVKWDERLLKENGNFDHIAVEIAISGERKVDMTLRERKAAARVLIREGAGIEVLSRHLGMTVSHALVMIDDMGYEVRSDPGAAHQGHSKLIMQKRKKGK